MNAFIEKLSQRQQQLAESRQTQLAHVLLAERQLQGEREKLAALDGAKSEVDRMLNDALLNAAPRPTD